MKKNNNGDKCIICGDYTKGTFCNQCRSRESCEAITDVTNDGRVTMIDVGLINLHLAVEVDNVVRHTNQYTNPESEFGECATPSCNLMYEDDRRLMAKDVAYHIPFPLKPSYDYDDYKTVVVRFVEPRFSENEESVEAGFMELFKLSKRYPFPMHIWVSPALFAVLPAALAYQPNFKLYIDVASDCSLVAQVVLHDTTRDEYHQRNDVTKRANFALSF